MTKNLSLLFCFLSLHAYAQRIDNTGSIRFISGLKYFRMSYDNDYFTATDRYYTQGINIEMVHPVLQKNPLIKILPKLNNSIQKQGLAIDHFGFTPTSIRRDTIIKNDRPFAAVIMLKSFTISIDTINKSLLSSSLSLGMIGPAAFGEAMQSTIHRWIGDIAPLGWQYQIKNDLAISAELNHEKQIFNHRLFIINTEAQIKLGTINNKIRAGFNFKFGKLYSPFNLIKNGKIQCYVFNQSLVHFIAYDATLQGGLFNHQNPYTIDAKEISRITFQDNIGAVFIFKKCYLEYFQSVLTKEFSTGMLHRWGGLKIGGMF